MAGFQKFIALGNVTGEPEIHRTQSGKEIAKFSLAVNGFKEGSVEYFDIQWWEPNKALEYIQRGVPILIEGEFQKDSWTDKDGNKKHRWLVNARRVMLVGQRQGGGRRTRYEEGEGHPPEDYDAPQVSPADDEIPF